MQVKICSRCEIEKSIDGNFSPGHGKCHLCRKLEYEENNNQRKCRGCGKIKSRNEFEGADRYCIACHSLRDEREKESKRKSGVKYRREHPDKIKSKNQKVYKRKYYSDSPGHILNYRLQACRKRAKDKGLDLDIDLDFLLNLYSTQGGKCALTGIAFDFVFDENFSKRPFSPSVDRIDSKLGYSKNNVRLVCSSVNSALSEYGDYIFDIICEARINHKTYGKLYV